MRKLNYSEVRKRGCLYCTDCECGSGKYTECHHEKCPYHELDDVKDYHEYIKKTDDSGLAMALRELAKK